MAEQVAVSSGTGSRSVNFSGTGNYNAAPNEGISIEQMLSVMDMHSQLLMRKANQIDALVALVGKQHETLCGVIKILLDERTRQS